MSTTVLVGPFVLTVKLPNGMAVDPPGAAAVGTAAVGAAGVAVVIAVVVGMMGGLERRTGRDAWMRGVLDHDAPAAPPPCCVVGCFCCQAVANVVAIKQTQPTYIWHEKPLDPPRSRGRP